ncbi:hypothetical protein [Enterococcus sp. UD-01]|jgi:hypothetical protein|uniref:hypothetical protein n=1 Tax=Enterococcus sp. UD-01 TaxID=3373911 RepID=UPI003838CADA
MKDSARYGKPFNDNQVKNHMGKAVAVALNILNQECKDIISAIALPNNVIYKKEINGIQIPLIQLGIVSKDSVLDYFCGSKKME